mgnify:CR=1 FL=1
MAAHHVDRTVGPANPTEPVGAVRYVEGPEYRSEIAVQEYEDGTLYQLQTTRGASAEVVTWAAEYLPNALLIDVVDPHQLGEMDNDCIYLSFWAPNAKEVEGER